MNVQNFWNIGKVWKIKYTYIKGHNYLEILKISIFFLLFSIIYTFKNNIYK